MLNAQTNAATGATGTEPHTPPPPRAAPVTGKILIADDNKANRLLLRGILRRQGYSLIDAEDGGAAVETALREQPDLILLDIVMPGKDGYQACAELRAHPETADTPVIFLSALSQPADKIKGLELGAVDYITKPFDKGEVLARVRNQLQIRKLTRDLQLVNDDLRSKQERLDEDLRAAGCIQQTLLPAMAPDIDAVRLAWRFTPCDRVGGDIFNFHQAEGEHLVVYVADVAGHGVPAAMITVSLSQTLSPSTRQLSLSAPPREVLARLDRMYPLERFGRYFTICYLRLDTGRGELRYSSAGHPAPLLLRAGGGYEWLGAGGTIIGLGDLVPFEESAIHLARGDRIFLYTDGIVEFENDRGEQFGQERLFRAAAAAAGASLEAACDHVTDALLAFGHGQALEDDFTLVAMEFCGK